MAESTVPALPEPPQAFESFLSLEFGRQIGLMVGLAASVALGVGLALWLVLEKDYTPLYDNLDRVDGAAVISLLESKQIDYRIDRTSGALLVDSAKLHEARLEVSAAGMPVDSTVGFELLEREQPLGTSQFMESARYRRGLEGELSRTITSISSVRAARVHLAIPKSSVFLRDTSAPRASVFLETYQGMSVGEPEVKAIANLVASSIPELTLSNVTVVDQRGKLLSNFENDDRFAAADRQLEYQRAMEDKLLQRLDSLLTPILGREQFRAEVAVDLDFTHSEQTAEIYNPDLPAVRSEQTTTEQTQDGAQAGGVPGALNNQPAAAGNLEGAQAQDGGNANASTRSRVLETRNFELDRTISHTRQQVGAVQKITVAVAVDDRPLPNSSEEQGEATQSSNPWTQEELDRLVVLVQNAVGYEATRGDRVSVVNTPFFKPEIEELVELQIPLWEQSIFWTVLKVVGAVVAFFVVVFMVLRPTMTRLTENSRRLKELEFKHQQALEAVTEVAKGAEATISEDGNVSLSNRGFLPSPGDQLDSQIGHARELVTNDPERVAQVIQGWSGKDE